MLRDILKEEISTIVREMTKGGLAEAPELKLSEPEHPENGDYAAAVAFLLAKAMAKRPDEIAEEMKEKLEKSSRVVGRIEAKKGFLNVFLKDEALLAALKEKVRFPKKKEKINVEFISANPTGPLTMANGRGGFYGDVLSNVLEKFYEEVTREYYINDAGNQIRIFGETLLAKLKELQGIAPRPEHYRGKYIDEFMEINAGLLSKTLRDLYSSGHLRNPKGTPAILKTGDYTQIEFTLTPGDIERIGAEEANYFINNVIRPSLWRIGIETEMGERGEEGVKKFYWFSEKRDLRDKGIIDAVLKLLESKGFVERREGAVWFGERVLVKSDGEPTYLLADIAYQYQKLAERGFDRAITIVGADHHAEAQGVLKGLEALDIIKRLEVITVQLVRLVRGGKEVRMSKRAGEFVTLDDLIKEVGPDIARWFFLEKSLNTHVDFDLDLAKERSEKNPVYYVQYAHTRMASILKKSKIRNQNFKIKEFSHPEERKLVMKILRYSELLEDVARDYQVHGLTTYAYELAQTFSAFYRDARVIGSEREAERLYLVEKARETLGDLLKLLGISAPEKM